MSYTQSHAWLGTPCPLQLSTPFGSGGTSRYRCCREEVRVCGKALTVTPFASGMPRAASQKRVHPVSRAGGRSKARSAGSQKGQVEPACLRPKVISLWQLRSLRSKHLNPPTPMELISDPNHPRIGSGRRTCLNSLILPTKGVRRPSLTPEILTSIQPLIVGSPPW